MLEKARRVQKVK